MKRVKQPGPGTADLALVRTPHERKDTVPVKKIREYPQASKKATIDLINVVMHRIAEGLLNPTAGRAIAELARSQNRLMQPGEDEPGEQEASALTDEELEAKLSELPGAKCT